MTTQAQPPAGRELTGLALRDRTWRAMGVAPRGVGNLWRWPSGEPVIHDGLYTTKRVDELPAVESDPMALGHMFRWLGAQCMDYEIRHYFCGNGEEYVDAVLRAVGVDIEAEGECVGEALCRAIVAWHEAPGDGAQGQGGHNVG